MKITFVPEDKDIFKNKIIETKCAIIFIEYMDGTIREKYWRIKNLTCINLLTFISLYVNILTNDFGEEN